MNRVCKQEKSVEVLTFIEYYLPGYKSGGPVRSVSNLVNQMGDAFRFKVVTADRDEGDAQPYSGIAENQWNVIHKSQVLYLSPGQKNILHLRRLMLNTQYDRIYLNGLFAPFYNIQPMLLRRLKLIPQKPTVLAPRGQLAPGALKFKTLKKVLFLVAARVLGLYRGITWQASSKVEGNEIQRWFGKQARVVVASNLGADPANRFDSRHRRKKIPGKLKAVFLSRIARKKNLDGALRLLSRFEHDLTFNIYGPMEDENYWQECREIIKNLPDNIQVQYCGPVSNDRVHAMLQDHDLLFFPTWGENFGHVILESLLAGCPVLISDQTPWRELEKRGIGWDIPNDEPEKFLSALNDCCQMDLKEHQRVSDRARRFGNEFLNDGKTIEKHKELFLQ